MEYYRNEHNSIQKEKEEEFWNIMLVCQGCRNTISQTKWFKQQKIISHASGGWEPKIKVSTSLVFSRGLFLLLGDGCPLSWSSYDVSLCDTTLTALRVAEFPPLKRGSVRMG